VDLSAIEPGLCAWVAARTGITASLVTFENAARPQFTTGGRALLSWVSMTAKDTPGVVWDYESQGAEGDALDEMVPTVLGDRVLVLQVGVETIDHRPGYSASVLAQRLVDRAHAPSADAALEVLNLGLADVGAPQRADYEADRRMVSRAVVELRFNASFAFNDDDGRTASITSVEVGATVTGSNGSALPDSVDGGGTFDGP
jgi:hypothetical protein